MAITLEDRAARICRQENLPNPKVEHLEFGFQRIKLVCRSMAEFDTLLHRAIKLRDVKIVRTWTCFAGGVYEGYIWLMDEADADAYHAKMEEKRAYLEDWWQRYHNADEETRSLMACGKIG